MSKRRRRAEAAKRVRLRISLRQTRPATRLQQAPPLVTLTLARPLLLLGLGNLEIFSPPAHCRPCLPTYIRQPPSTLSHPKGFPLRFFSNNSTIINTP